MARHEGVTPLTAARAQVLAQFLGKTKKALRDSTTALVMLNQARDKFGQSFGYGEQLIQPGGRAPRFYASIIAKMKSQGDPLIDKRTGEVVVRTFKLGTTKNKVSAPYREAAVPVIMQQGLADIFADLAALGKAFDLFTDAEGHTLRGKKGAPNWFYQGQKLGQGENATIQALQDDRELAVQVDLEIRAEIAQMNKGDLPVIQEAEPDGLEIVFEDDILPSERF